MKQGITLILTWLCTVYVESYIVNPGPRYVATKGAVWPRPQVQLMADDYFVLDPNNFKFAFEPSAAPCTLLDNALQRYYEILQKNTVHPKIRPSIITLQEGRYLGAIIELEVNLNGTCDDAEYPGINMEESYNLTVASETPCLTSTSVWGILRGLETFSQLLYLSVDRLTVRVNATLIEDYPRFKHRGLMMDTARHYIPIEQIHQAIDGMAYNKLNVFHWHIVDDQSFPFVSRTFPELSELGAYDPELFVYTPQDVQGIIEYARQRGIRVIPEIDTPGHTRSWGVSHPELLTDCSPVEEGSYGPIDPTKNTTYSFLQSLLAEIREVFVDQFVHLGGDEVDFDCWGNDTNITEFMKEANITTYEELESYYIQKVIDIADDLNFSSVVWQEVFTNGVKLPNETIVHIWRDWEGNWWNETMDNVTKAGKTALLSACWYLDHLNTGGDWQSFYKCEPTVFGGTPEQAQLILGGEACMWAEVVNQYNVVQRIWPRASAPAEKLWSAYYEDPDLDVVAQRLEEHVCRMNRRGIPAQPPTASGFCL